MLPAANNQHFPLGGDDRLKYALDLKTGQIVATDARNLAAMGTLAPADVTIAAIQKIFDTIGYKTSYDGDGHLLVESDIAFVNILIEPNGQFLRFVSGLELNTYADDELKIALANRLNDEYNLVRFFVPEPSTFRADYTLMYDGGLSVERLVVNLERFAEIVLAVFTGTEDLKLIVQE
jgi:hypothetical protein